MSRLVWDEIGKKFYEAGVEKCVLYLLEDGQYKNGVAWNGITNVSENPSGGEPQPQYADNIKYINIMSREEFAATIEAFTYPDEFGVCDGSVEVATGITIGQQTRRPFGISYQTKIGNDVDQEEHGYKIHLIYNALAKPSQKQYQTINENPEANNFSWELSTTPISVKGHKPTASLVINSTKTDPEKLKELEDIIYGSDTLEPRMPDPDEIISIVGEQAVEAEG